MSVKKVVRSRPTMCLRCHLVVEMDRGASSWSCPRCGHKYEFRFWKIKPALRVRSV